MAEGNGFADTWWRFDRYEVALREGEHLPDLVIRPAPGATPKSYSVSEAHRTLGPSRSAYLQLAHIGEKLRHWFFAVPFELWHDWETFREIEDTFSLLDWIETRESERQGGAENVRAAYRQWLEDALSRGLHEPVLEWCQRFGLLGVPDLGSEEGRQKAFKRLRERNDPKWRDDIAAWADTTDYWRTYEESMPRFVHAVMGHDVGSSAHRGPGP